MNDIFTPVEVERPSSRSKRGKIIALIVATVGLVAIAGAGSAFALQAASSVTDHSLEHASTVSGPPTSETVANPAQPAAPATSKTDKYGAPIYDLTTDPAAIIIPDSFSPDERANAELWVKQQLLVAQCMADSGFDYVFQLFWERSELDPRNALYPIGTPGYEALWGTNPTETGAYTWENAGCDGYAVQMTGQDDTN